MSRLSGNFFAPCRCLGCHMKTFRGDLCQFRHFKSVNIDTFGSEFSPPFENVGFSFYDISDKYIILTYPGIFRNISASSHVNKSSWSHQEIIAGMTTSQGNFFREELFFYINDCRDNAIHISMSTIERSRNGIAMWQPPEVKLG